MKIKIIITKVRRALDHRQSKRKRWSLPLVTGSLLRQSVAPGAGLHKSAEEKNTFKTYYSSFLANKKSNSYIKSCFCTIIYLIIV